MVRRSAKTEDIHLLADHDTRVRGGLTLVRGSRNVTVEGDYDRNTDDVEMLAVDGTHIREEVRSNVFLHATFESEAIMGGGYVSSNVGPFFRLAGMHDTMAWGAYAEVDVARVEIVYGASIKAYFGYTHNVGARKVFARQYVDDFVTRTENYGTLNDNQTTVVKAGGPGAGVVSAM